MPRLPGYDEWLDNYGDPGLPTENDLINWREANEYADEEPDDYLDDDYLDE